MTRNQKLAPALTVLARYVGLEDSPASHTERLVSTLGGIVVIACVFVIATAALGPAGALIIVPSMGASAVLLFAVPCGALSQPWNVVGGHLISALIGVSCALTIPDEVLAGSLAVGLAIGAMHYLRCIHPPGGATALAAVIGGETTQALGYQYVLTPIMLNVSVMMVVAVAFNNLFPWRRYPAWLAASKRPLIAEPGINEGDLGAALAGVDTFIDVSQHDLLRIYQGASGAARRRHLSPGQILVGHSYGNGEGGKDCSIRLIIAESPDPNSEKDLVVYEVIAGVGYGTSAKETRAEFSKWAREELTHKSKAP